MPTAEAIDVVIELLLNERVFNPFLVVVPYVGPETIVTERPSPDLSVHALIGLVPVIVVASAASNHSAHPAILVGIKFV